MLEQPRAGRPVDCAVDSPAAEQATALVEIAKIANLRLLDIVEEPVDQPAG